MRWKVAACRRSSTPIKAASSPVSAFTGMLEASGIRCSMDGRGRCLDNVFIERLWRSLKYEAVYLRELKDGFEAQRVIAQWLEFLQRSAPPLGVAWTHAGRGLPRPVGRLQSRWRSGGGEADTAASSEHSGQVVGQYGAGTYPHIHRLGHPPAPGPPPPITATCLREGGVG